MNQKKSKKALFICGSLNQTTQMHAISLEMTDFECYFSPFYSDGLLKWLQQKGLLNFTILGGNFFKNTMEYLLTNNLQVDYRGTEHEYDIVFTCTDLIYQKNILNKPVILVQEGMTDPENVFFYLAKYAKFPRYLASTSTTGISNLYSLFCVASEGYKNLFIRKGADQSKIVVTGIPNFDNCKEYTQSRFPYSNFVLVATSDSRETFKYHNRKKFIQKAVQIANDRQLIFKLHPNEIFDRAISEINKYAPGSVVFTSGNIHEMIAHSSELITEYSSTVFTGLALGKKVHSRFPLHELMKLLPEQNGGKSAKNIAAVALQFLSELHNRKNDQLNSQLPQPKKLNPELSFEL